MLLENQGNNKREIAQKKFFLNRKENTITFHDMSNLSLLREGDSEARRCYSCCIWRKAC